jgi:hypothetical protein
MPSIEEHSGKRAPVGPPPSAEAIYRDLREKLRDVVPDSRCTTRCRTTPATRSS